MIYLVGGFNLSLLKNMSSSIWMIITKIWKNKIHVPNNQRNYDCAFWTRNIAIKFGLKRYEVKPRLAKQIRVYLVVSKRKNPKQGYLIPCDVTAF